MFSGNFADTATSTPFRKLLHAANLRHGTDGFTSSPKEGVLRISKKVIELKIYFLISSITSVRKKNPYFGKNLASRYYKYTYIFMKVLVILVGF